MAKCIAAVKRGYPEKEGPFVNILGNALQSFGVQRCSMLVGIYWHSRPLVMICICKRIIHIAKLLQALIIQTMRTSIFQLAKEKLPHYLKKKFAIKCSIKEGLPFKPPCAQSAQT